MIFSKKACEKTRAICEWCGARHLRSGGKSNYSGASCWFGLEPVQVVGLTSEEGLIRGAGPIGLDLPQRGLGETGKSPNTTIKHHRVIVVCSLCFTLLQFIFLEFILLACLCLFAIIFNSLLLLVHLVKTS